MLPEVAYLAWIRAAWRRTRHSLSSSGMPPPDAARLASVPFDLPAVLSRKVQDGAGRLEAAVATRQGVDAAAVVAGAGTTGANFLVMAGCLSPGDEVVVETPGYGPLEATARALGARVRPLTRRPEDGYQPDPEDPVLSERTRLVILTDPHNPSGVRLTPDRLAALVAWAAGTGAILLVDEVYREAAAEPWPTAFEAAGPVVATGSLTKAYGLSALRAGWAMAPAPIAAACRAAADHVAPGSLEPGWSFAAAFLESPVADAVLGDTRAHLAYAGARFAAFRARCPGWAGPAPDVPCVAFPAVPRGLGTGTALAAALLDGTGTLVVPGAFFGDDARVRLAFGAPQADLTAGLEALARFSPSPEG